MSWFDTAGLANLAKTALKEAQKQIDKALDIKEDGVSPPSSDVNKIVTSRTEPSTPSDGSIKNNNPAISSSVWGSFTGSFFDNPQANEMTTVTTPPSSMNKEFREPHGNNSESDGGTTNRDNSGCSSESVDLLSTPTTPGSSITSPIQSSASTMLNSESVEVLGVDTPSDASSVFVVASNVTTPGSDCQGVLKIAAENPDFATENLEEDASGDEDSMSYNTVSDSMAVTVMEPIVVANTEEPITVPPSRQSLHLSFSSSSKSDQSRLTISESSTCDTEDSNESERTITSDGKSGQVSSLIEDAIENFEMQTQLSDSTQSFEEVQPVLLDSMLQEAQRQLSPNSSDGKSDLLKICSEQTSGHTSADEVETATSSDIEIISSPNGDSSSTHSTYRTSPLKDTAVKSIHTDLTRKIKGHNRELSETSSQSIGSDELINPTEIERLQRRVSELSELLEKREYKLVELGRLNAELHERNVEMLKQIESKQKRSDSVEISNVTEEYTQRLSALEKKFQQSIRERDGLREQLKTIKAESFNKVAKIEVDKVINEKDFIIQELKQEGEKLSKQVLQHSNIIKKLRTKEKENDELMKRQKEQIEESLEETERLKKSLSAKEEVERSQIEAVHRLSSEKRKLDKENSQIKSQLEDITQKLETLQISFEAAKMELTEKKQQLSELIKKAESLEALTTEKHLTQTQNNQMIKELDDLREKLRQAESANMTREQNLRQENANLLRRLEEAEQRSEEQAQALSVSTIPLIKQLDALQNTLKLRTVAWEKQEKLLLDKLEIAEKKLITLINIEANSNEETLRLKSTITSLEERLSIALLKAEQTNSLLQQKEVEFQLKVGDYSREVKRLEEHQQQIEEEIETLRDKNSLLEKELQMERENLESEKRKISKLLLESQIKQMSSKDDTNHSHTLEATVDNRPEYEQSSPTLSLGHISLDESLGSNAWHMDDMDCISNHGRPSGGSIYGTNNIFAGAGHTSTLENLQSTLKQRDGELYQMQWELSRLQSEKSLLTSEISDMMIQLENLREKMEANENVREQFIELQRQYDALLQMYGEKLEETDELKLDLQDVKEMYKAQIDDLLRQQKAP